MRLVLAGITRLYGGVPALVRLLPAGFPPVCILYRRDSLRFEFDTGGITAVMRFIPAGFPPILVVYRRDSRRFCINIRSNNNTHRIY